MDEKKKSNRESEREREKESWSARGKRESSLKSQRRRKVEVKKSTWEKQPRQTTGNLSVCSLNASPAKKKSQLVHCYLLKTCCNLIFTSSSSFSPENQLGLSQMLK